MNVDLAIKAQVDKMTDKKNDKLIDPSLHAYIITSSWWMITSSIPQYTTNSNTSFTLEH